MIHEMPWPADLPDGDRVCEDAAGVPVIVGDEVVGEVASAWWYAPERGETRKSLALDLKTPDEYLDHWVSIEWSPRHRRILTVRLVPRVRLIGAS